MSDIPIRLKVGDPLPWEKVVILKNGEPIHDCVEVDVLNCTARRIWRDDRGQMLYDDTREEIKTYKDYGHFQIVWRDDDKQAVAKTED